MCFSYSVNFNADALQSRLQLEEIPLPASGFFFTAFQYPMLPVIASLENGPVCKNMQWGLIPGWCKSAEQAKELRKNGFNARAETVQEKPMFRHAFQTGRCLIPAAGFFEWKEWNKKKYPYYIFPKDDPAFLFAGIYENWVDEQSGELLQTYAILTCEANALMAEIHNTKKRMPVILPFTEALPWIQATESTVLSAMLKPISEDRMNAFSISPLAGNIRENRNTIAVQKPYVYPELEQKLLF